MKKILLIIPLVLVLAGCSFSNQNTAVNSTGQNYPGTTDQNSQIQTNETSNVNSTSTDQTKKTEPVTPVTPTAPTTPAPQIISEQKVAIKNFAFDPAVLTIKKGEKVVWTNEDNVPHIIASDDNQPNGVSFLSGSLANGASFSFKFDAVGTYNYHCQIHRSMTGQIIVE